MSKVSAWQKAGIVARVAGKQAGRNRTLNAIKSAARATAKSFAHVIHILWLEVVGIIFFVMALSFAGASVKEYGKYHAGQIGPGRVEVAALFAILFAWFGLSSFLRVHRKSKRT